MGETKRRVCRGTQKGMVRGEGQRPFIIWVNGLSRAFRLFKVALDFHKNLITRKYPLNFLCIVTTIPSEDLKERVYGRNNNQNFFLLAVEANMYPHRQFDPSFVSDLTHLSQPNSELLLQTTYFNLFHLCKWSRSTPGRPLFH